MKKLIVTKKVSWMQNLFTDPPTLDKNTKQKRQKFATNRGIFGVFGVVFFECKNDSVSLFLDVGNFRNLQFSTQGRFGIVNN